jgi:hypothetical protein
MNKTCMFCCTKGSKNDMVFHEGMWYCKECASDQLKACSDCGQLNRWGQLRKWAYDYFCHACYDKNIITCDCCGKEITVKTEHTRTGKQLCRNCRECVRCGEAYLKQDVREGLCQSCWFESH